MDYKELYDTNKEFREFVDKTCKGYGLTVMDALGLHTVKDVGDYYATKDADTVVSETKIEAGC